jgi:PAS domain S-box-containing protein
MVKPTLSKLTIFLLLDLFVCLIVMPSHSSATKKQVLILHSYNQGSSWTDKVMHGMLSALKNSGMDLEINVEYMDTKRHPPKESFTYLGNFYRQKYGKTAFDIILLSDNNALTFILSRRDKLFPDVPVVLCGINNFSKELLGDQTGITGITEEIDVKGTIAFATRIMPSIQKFIVINDRTPTGRANLEKFRHAVSNLPTANISFELLDDITAADLRERLTRLPPDSGVLVFTFHRDKSGQSFSIPEYWGLIRNSCRSPIFSFWDSDLGRGVLGGVMVYGEEQGKRCAQYAIRILKGEPADSIPILFDSPNVPVLDYRLLKKFKIPKANIPADTVVLFEPQSLFSKYRNEIIITGILFAILTFLVIVLSVNILIRRRTERALIKSEALLGATQRLAKVGGWEWDVEKDTMFWTEEVYRIHGFDPEEIPPGATEHIQLSLECYDPEDRPVIMAAYERCAKEGREYDLEFPFTRQDGQRLWIRTTARPVISDGRIIKVIGSIMDISGQKQAIEALRESEQKYRTLTDSSITGVFIHQDGKYVFVNDRFAEMLGYKPEELLSRDRFDLIHPDQREIIRVRGEKRLNGEEVSHRYEIKRLKKDGKVVWHEIMVSDPIMYRGRPAIMGHEIDITERKRAEEVIREKERFHEGILNDMITFVAVLDSSGDVIFVNNTPLTVGGIELEDIRGKKFFDAFWWTHSDEVREMIKRDIEQCASGESIVHDVPIRTSDGSLMWIEFSMHPIYDEYGVVHYLIPEGRDITANKKAAEALRESEEKYRSHFENVSDVIYSVDLELKIRAVSPSVEKILGYRPDEIIGLTFQELNILAPEYLTTAFSDVKRVLAGENITSSVYEFIAKDGSRKMGEVSGSPLIMQGKIIGVISVARDITEKRKLEDQIHRSQKMESLGLMAGGIAHDLNNILSGIVAYPDLLLLDLPENSPLREPIEAMKESGLRAADVVADLLTIAKGAATSKEVLNLNSIVGEYLNSPEQKKLKNMRPSIAFKTELESDLLNMSCSATHIKKILINLVANASEAIETSGTVTISTMNRYLDEPLKRYEDVCQGEYAVLSVSDDGLGISPDDLERIFEPFYTKKMMGRSGTGLGLAVVWNTVQDHDGYINVESSEKGTVFELYFPVTREEVISGKEKVPLEGYLGNGENILVVDDEKRQRDIARGLLTKLGYKADAVSSGEEAIEYVKEHPVDLMVLDMIMPKGINGRKTYEEIIKIRPGQKAIIASGFSETEDVKIAQSLGAGKYIKKPYTLEKIGIAVKEELEK